ncbi:G patch domain-containing protein 11 [Mytilus coruscus]|uniref:G patch domain-containing protein 11 n=1 Tax=Mytilus coruscus TaxID=42192 RepID=A0A6J8A9C4_MYTCO|nr:G patch domain-containing protein 11 [Mytilus coruscus]
MSANLDDEEDDYMSDAILTKCTDTRPGLVSANAARIHKVEKKIRESNIKNIVKPKSVVEHEKREEGLQAAIKSDNKGFALLAKMGYKPGMGIGKQGEGRKEPVGINVKTEQWAAMRTSRHIKRQKMESNLKRDFQQRMSSKFIDCKAERDVIKSQKVCEQLDSEMGTTIPDEWYFWPKSMLPKKKQKNETETGLSFEVVEEEEDDDEDEEEEEDFLTNQEKLEALTAYLRTIHLYCIWCGNKFEDEDDLSTNCPGDTADAHDE